MKLLTEEWGFRLLDDDEVVELGEGLRQHGVGAYQPRPRTAKTQDAHQVLRVERARWSKQEDEFRKHVQTLLAEFQSGSISDKQLISRFSNNLYRFQVAAFNLGKRTAGNFSNSMTEMEKRQLHGQHSREMRFFHNFVRTMNNKGGKMRYDHRADLYALGGYSVYLRGVLSGLPDAGNIRWNWDVNIEKENCVDCLQRQFESRRKEGYTTFELLNTVGLPSEKTRCMHRCGCGISPIGFTLPTKRTRPTTFSHVLSLIERS